MIPDTQNLTSYLQKFKIKKSTPKERNLLLSQEIYDTYKIPHTVALKFMNDIGLRAVEEIFYQMKKQGKAKELFLWQCNEDKKKIVWK